MRRDTKEIIWKKALDLFSKQGYEGVSVKAIADAVGIKDSSLYKHYKSKREIFDTILQEVSRRIDEMHKSLAIPMGEDEAEIYENITQEHLEKLCLGLFNFYLKDDVVSKYRRLLTIEQYSNSEVSELFHKFFIDGALEHEAGLFKELIKKGWFRSGDPYVMALHFYSPLFIMLYKFDTPHMNEEELVNLIRAHIAAFSQNYVNLQKKT